MSSSEYCIYIPRVSGFYSREVVARIISTHIGTVERVDAIALPDTNHKGMTDYDFSAFVYISRFNRSNFAQDVFNNWLEQHKPFEFLLDTDESWFLVKNPHIPINRQSRRMNELEVQVEELSVKFVSQNAVNYKQQQTIERLESIVQNQTTDIHRMQRTIYQILGSIYDQRTDASQMCQLYNSMMHGKNITTRVMLDENDDGSEEYARAFMMEDEEGDGDEEEDNTGKSYPLIDASASIPLTDRLKNTAELCGNN